MVNDTEIPFRMICRMSAELRRCGWYVFSGAVVVMSMMVVLAQMQLIPRKPWEVALVSGFMVLASLGLVVSIQSWALLIDSKGMARRRLWVWDQWPWEEFREGKVTRRNSALIARDHRWCCRELLLELIEERESDLVIKLWKQLSPQVTADAVLDNLPTEITVRYGLRTASFGVGGFRFTNNPFAAETPWKDVRELRIILNEHERPEIHKVEIVLDNKTETLIGIYTIQTSEMSETICDQPRKSLILAGYLRSRVPSQLLRVYARKGEPHSQEEYDYWIVPVEKQLRDFTRLRWIVPTVFFGLVVVAFFPKLLGPGLLPNQGWFIVSAVLFILMISMYPLIAWAVVQNARQGLMRRIQKLQSWRAQQEKREE